ncbi:unnamed protein product [marine sediment metagenome]|uniref:Uncharacterized protein n=1 Tax=marine sediment metagenome TaxID=412755 RepID=X0YUV0_9ZZZZ
MEQDKNNQEKGVKFNAGELFLKIIGGLINKAGNFRLSGDHNAWFIVLQDIKCKATKIVEKEMKELESMEDVINDNMYGFKPAQFDNDNWVNLTEEERGLINSHNNQQKVKLNRSIEKYEIKIMSLLDRYHYLIPEKESRTGLFGQKE